MKKYILVRILKSLVSIFLVVSIVLAMIYTMIPTTKVFEQDPAFRRLSGSEAINYRYGKLDELGYLDNMTMSEMCQESSDDYSACMVSDSEENLRVLKIYEDKGYTIERLVKYQDPDDRSEATVNYIAHYDYNALQIIFNFWTKLVKIDHSGYVNSAYADKLSEPVEEKYYFGTDQNGVIALMCSGCQYKYQIYIDGNFPFIHQNVFKLNFGNSFPANAGVPTMEVISKGQGEQKMTEQTFPSGITQMSPYIQTSCEFMPTPDQASLRLFPDQYADCLSSYSSPSMIMTSYIFGIASLILVYAIALPFGISMAQHKGKFIDKFGVVIINLLISLPSLALIFFLKYIGSFFGMPDKFPQLGFNNIRSYILPIIILALLSLPSLMMWIRRYMVDQSNADYVKFAKAKGLSQKEIFHKHILKNAIIPIINGIPGSIILCISGAFITESVFAIPGMGKMLPDSIKIANNNMVITITFILTTLSVFSVLLGDLLMTVVDPRIQLSAKGDD